MAYRTSKLNLRRDCKATEGNMTLSRISGKDSKMIYGRVIEEVRFPYVSNHE